MNVKTVTACQLITCLIEHSLSTEVRYYYLHISINYVLDLNLKEPMNGPKFANQTHQLKSARQIKAIEFTLPDSATNFLIDQCLRRYHLKKMNTADK